MTRKTVWLLVSIMVLLAGGLTMLAGNGAVVIDEQVCGLLDGNGGLTSADSSQGVTTGSNNGKLTCKANVAPPSLGKAVQFDHSNTGLPCNTPVGPTDDWQETVSASGQATLSCHVNGS